jgi:uncharacterized membrane protein YjjP (DUF1212 family)
MSNGESIQNVNEDQKKWSWAITEAESLLQKVENRAARLNGAIKTFTELRDAKHSYTGPKSAGEI